MPEEKKKKRYFVLNNPKATIFTDIFSGFTVHSHKVPEATEVVTKQMLTAIKGGHIKEVEAPVEAKTSLPSKKESAKELKERLTKMSVEERVAYYKENFEDVTETDIEALTKMTEDKQVKFLLED